MQGVFVSQLPQSLCELPDRSRLEREAREAIPKRMLEALPLGLGF
jgi:hypothetical protein